MHPGILGQKGFPLSQGNAHLFLGNHPKQTRARFKLSCKLLVKAYSGKSLVKFLKMSIFIASVCIIAYGVKYKRTIFCYYELFTAVFLQNSVFSFTIP